MDLMYCEPKPDSEGRILATPSGGCRRIDKLIYDPKCQVSLNGAQFCI